MQGYPAPGEQIAGFRVTRRLGGGGMGVVYAATQLDLDREVALKVLPPHLAEDRDFRVRFAREARAMAALDSPHTVQVHTYGEAGGRLYLAQQLVPDGDLERMLRARGAPPMGLALDLVAQVASGLADAHEAGLIHRDIKPANVLLRERTGGVTAYLGDFGIARIATSEDQTVHAVGTPAYMAPELHTGSPGGVATDVYSLGCLLWATLSGRPPYAGHSDFQIVSAHLDRPVPRLAGDSPQVQHVNRILQRSMAKDPAQRYPSAAAMRDDLRYAAGLGGASGAVAVPMPSPGPRRRRTGLLLGGAVAAALVVAGVVLALTLGGDDPGADRPGAGPASDPGGATSTSVAPPPGTLDEEQQRQVVNSIANAFAQQGTAISTARCIAETWTETVGFQALLDAGFVDAELRYVDQDIDAVDPQIKSGLAIATQDCFD